MRAGSWARWCTLLWPRRAQAMAAVLLFHSWCAAPTIHYCKKGIVCSGARKACSHLYLCACSLAVQTCSARISRACRRQEGGKRLLHGQWSCFAGRDSGSKETGVPGPVLEKLLVVSRLHHKADQGFRVYYVNLNLNLNVNLNAVDGCRSALWRRTSGMWRGRLRPASPQPQVCFLRRT